MKKRSNWMPQESQLEGQSYCSANGVIKREGDIWPKSYLGMSAFRLAGGRSLSYIWHVD